jgi:hypothetical protein
MVSSIFPVPVMTAATTTPTAAIDTAVSNIRDRVNRFVVVMVCPSLRAGHTTPSTDEDARHARMVTSR